MLLQEQARSFEQKNIAGETVWQVKQTFRLQADEAFIWLRSIPGRYLMNYRGKEKPNWYRPTWRLLTRFCCPHSHTAFYGDNYSKTLFEDNEKGASFWSEVADGIDYYFIYGNDMHEVVAGYHQLTGKVPMFP